MLRVVSRFILLFVCCLASRPAWPSAVSVPAWPTTFEPWAQQRVGPVIYPTDPKAKNGWNQLDGNIAGHS